jgi:methionyl-tRNA formyltransferase
LPKYRGPIPVEQAILDGATESGTSIMRLVAEMDAGPLYAQNKTQLKGKETKAELADNLLSAGADLLIKHLPRILENPQDFKVQDESKATYTKLIGKEDGIISWDKPAEHIEREIRAFSGWPKSRTKLFDKPVIITKARVVKDSGDGDLVIECQSGWLEIQELTAPSGRSMGGAEFLRGYSKN